jgi:hypothetical protein
MPEIEKACNKIFVSLKINVICHQLSQISNRACSSNVGDERAEWMRRLGGHGLESMLPPPFLVPKKKQVHICAARNVGAYG